MRAGRGPTAGPGTGTAAIADGARPAGGELPAGRIAAAELRVSRVLVPEKVFPQGRQPRGGSRVVRG